MKGLTSSYFDIHIQTDKNKDGTFYTRFKAKTGSKPSSQTVEALSHLTLQSIGSHFFFEDWP